MNKKKIYLIGLIITTVFMIVKIIFVIGEASIVWIISNILLGYVFAHLYLGFSFAFMNLPRHYYQDWYIKHQQWGGWVVSIVMMGYATISYFFSIHEVTKAGFLTYGVVMLVIGALLEVRRHKERIEEEELKYSEEEPVDRFEKRLLEGKDQRNKW
ncbi:MAG: hypothetical protein C4537_02615 [Acholeplasma sp.]|nr:MAG: hypothetical protein C4537_02615 [Acholeplasma sp.]